MLACGKDSADTASIDTRKSLWRECQCWSEESIMKMLPMLTRRKPGGDTVSNVGMRKRTVWVRNFEVLNFPFLRIFFQNNNFTGFSFVDSVQTSGLCTGKQLVNVSHQ